MSAGLTEAASGVLSAGLTEAASGDVQGPCGRRKMTGWPPGGLVSGGRWPASATWWPGKFRVRYTIWGLVPAAAARRDLPGRGAPGDRAGRRHGEGMEDGDLAADKSSRMTLIHGTRDEWALPSVSGPACSEISLVFRDPADVNILCASIAAVNSGPRVTIPSATTRS